MTRLPVSFADETPLQPRQWTRWRIFAWSMLFASLGVWFAVTLMH
jgi:hypothetical protein